MKSLFRLIVFLILSILSSCTKTPVSTTAISGTIGGSYFSNSNAFAVNCDGRLNIYSDSTFYKNDKGIYMIFPQWDNTPQIGTYKIINNYSLGVQAGYNFADINTEASYGVVTVSSITPNIIANFSFTCVDSTKVKGTLNIKNVYTSYSFLPYGINASINNVPLGINTAYIGENGGLLSVSDGVNPFKGSIIYILFPSWVNNFDLLERYKIVTTGQPDVQMGSDYDTKSNYSFVNNGIVRIHSINPDIVCSFSGTCIDGTTITHGIFRVKNPGY